MVLGYVNDMQFVSKGKWILYQQIVEVGNSTKVNWAL